MRTQVITITVEGTMQGLQVKPGQGLDLTKFGPAKVIRASEIVWSEEHQAWKIDVLQEAGQGVVTIDKLLEAWGGRETFCLEEGSDQQVRKVIMHEVSRRIRGSAFVGAEDSSVCFYNYDDAVLIEVAYLNALRAKGIY